ncbi:MAG: hypothetical protein QY332_10370 [Anaerolineales bacterium]|nr:MAG: hypothetical protein QY332_10370 [Anaerolineales bacterium]
MKLAKPNKTLLLLQVERPMLGLRPYFFGSLSGWLIFGLLGALSADAGWGGYVLIAGRIIAFTAGLSSMLLGLLLLSESLDHPVDQCVFDRSTRSVTLSKRVMWILWRESREQYLCDAIASVRISQNENQAELGLNLKDGEAIHLGSDNGEGHLTEIAEEMSDFLGLPLCIRIGSQQIEKYSRNAMKIQPLLCSRCGGQFPKFNEDARQVHCEYCQTSFALIWEAEHVSIKPRPGGDLSGRHARKLK